jgi:PAS domain S-box-containing protein
VAASDNRWTLRSLGKESTLADFPNEQGDHAQRYWRTPVEVPSLLDDPDHARLDEEFTRFAEYLPTLCWLARGDGYIVWYNRRWHDYCGTTASQMEGWGWQEVHDPTRLSLVMEGWTSAIATGEPFEMEFPLRGADGIFRPFLTRVVPVRDATNQVVRWYGVNTEIGAQVAAERALMASQADFAALTDAMPQMVWSTLPDGFHDYYNAQWYAFTGVPAGSTDGEGWSDLFHADDRDLAWDRWRHSLATGEAYEVEYRLRHHSGTYRWTLGRALPVEDELGQINRWIGTCTDIDDAKRAAEQNELLSRELSHRIKNIFAVIAGLISLTGRKSAELEPMTTELLDRIAALGRAHEFARPHSPRSTPPKASGTLRGLIAEILKPYNRAAGDRVVITGDEVAVDDRGATPISLLAHELATNSAKYGALSVENGRVTILVRQAGGDVTISWVEHGGPFLDGAPTSRGFGSELARLSVERQLGGTLTYDWHHDGLRVLIKLETTRLSR